MLKPKDIGKKLTIILFIIILSNFFVIEISKLNTWEHSHDYIYRLQEIKDIDLSRIILGTSLLEIGSIVIQKISFQVLGNSEVLDLISSISMLILTYFISKQFTKTRISGIISMGLLSLSPIFEIYSTTLAYPTFWISFYLLSLYLILVKSKLSSIVLFLSMTMKVLTIGFLPINLFIIWFKQDLYNSTREKIIASLPYLGSVIFLVLIYHIHKGYNILKLDFSHILNTLYSIPYLLFTDYVLLFMLAFGAICIIFTDIKKSKDLRIFSFMIIWFIVIAVSISVLTIYDNQVYRMIPLIVFLALQTGFIIGIKIKNNTVIPSDYQTNP